MKRFDLVWNVINKGPLQGFQDNPVVYKGKGLYPGIDNFFLSKDIDQTYLTVL